MFEKHLLVSTEQKHFQYLVTRFVFSSGEILALRLLQKSFGVLCCISATQSVNSLHRFSEAQMSSSLTFLLSWWHVLGDSLCSDKAPVLLQSLRYMVPCISSSWTFIKQAATKHDSSTTMLDCVERVLPVIFISLSLLPNQMGQADVNDSSLIWSKKSSSRM